MKKTRKINIFLISLIFFGTCILGVQKYLEKDERNMEFDSALEIALNTIEELQSLSIASGPSVYTEPEILELGEKVLKIRDAFAFNDDRIEVLREDQAYFENQVATTLGNLFPGDNGIDQAIEELKQPAAFITAYSNYVATVPGLLATSLSISTSDLPGTSDAFWEDVFEITKDAREIRARLRGNDWLENFEEKLCIPVDVGTDTEGVSMISFYRDANGHVVHSEPEVLEGVCQETVGSDSYDMYANRPVCIANQIQDAWSSEKCNHGCEGGRCIPAPEPDFCSVTDCVHGCENGACLPEPVKLSHFEILSQSVIQANNEQKYNLEVVVIAKNNDDSIATNYDGKGLIIVTGDGEAEFPQNIDLTLTDGVGFFPITLTTLDDVSISYKDVSNRINGSELTTELQIYNSNNRAFIGIISSEVILGPDAVMIPIYGCTDNASSNYNPEANIDDQSCL